MTDYKKDNATGINHEGAHPNEPLRYLTASSIMGDKVRNLEGDQMGAIKDLMIDLGKGSITYVVIELGGFLGIGEKYFALPFSLLKVDGASQTFILDQKREKLEKAPGFNKDHWPETNSHVYTNSASYWGGFMGANSGATPY